jgi:hypothetical protein
VTGDDYGGDVDIDDSDDDDFDYGDFDEELSNLKFN